MNHIRIRPYQFTLALIACAASFGTANANPRPGGSIYIPSVSAPPVNYGNAGRVGADSARAGADAARSSVDAARAGTGSAVFGGTVGGTDNAPNWQRGGGNPIIDAVARAALGGSVAGMPGGDYMVSETVRAAQELARQQQEAAREAALRPAQNSLNQANENYRNATQAAVDAQQRANDLGYNDAMVLNRLSPEDRMALGRQPGATEAEQLNNLRRAREAEQRAAEANRDAVYTTKVAAENRVDGIKNAH